MNFWSTRFAIPGLYFIGFTYLLLHRTPPFATISINSTTALITVIAGFPIGYIISLINAIVYNFFFKRGGTFIIHRKFRNSILKIFKGFNKNKDVKEILKLIENCAIRDHVFYALAWDTLSHQRFQNRSHRRFEMFHTTCGSIIAVLLAVIISIIYYISSQDSCINLYLHDQWRVLIVILLVLALLLYHAYDVVHDIAHLENTWALMIISFYKNKPKDLLQKLLLSEGLDNMQD